ncbi:hypothetical protein XF_0581 [Xylella fastidiosa 9a5c]|uniref:Uncharacterized protein n=1 Tax=Xylella fastidiosa (strain 9a5c) TaxID=160492 RepID=Q9PFS6_XYLFA|nr:hypothetical protein XF_0581 [Xylella fastidiosa 9a5c]
MRQWHDMLEALRIGGLRVAGFHQGEPLCATGYEPSLYRQGAGTAAKAAVSESNARSCCYHTAAHDVVWL